MFSEKYRIRKKRDIEKIFKKGKIFKKDFLILKTIKNNLSFCRFGFIVSKKISGKAVVRNRVKRKIREAVSANLMKLNQSSDNLFIALTGIEKNNLREIDKTVEELLKKAKIL